MADVAKRHCRTDRKPTRAPAGPEPRSASALGLCLQIASLIALAAAPTRVIAADQAPHADFRATGAQVGVTLDDTPEARPEAVLARVLSPLAAESARRALAKRSLRLAPSIDLAQERFTLYVPSSPPPGGYGVLVFVSPWNYAPLPSGWGPILDRHGVIFVSAAKSGNDQSVLGRRIPLALVAVEAILHHYRVDPNRVYVGGFSGGSRVALWMALYYPDLFRGALLNAGSDDLAAPPLALPDPARLEAFRSSALALVTGGLDTFHKSMDASALRSFRRWCVRDVAVLNNPFAGHVIASPADLDRALGVLDAHAGKAPEPDTGCEEARRAEVQAALERAKSAVARGQRDSARRLLLELDRTYGGLAGPDLVALADQCGCGALSDGPLPAGKDEP